MDGRDEVVPPAEGLDQLHRRADVGEGRDAQHVGVIQVEHALVGIFGQQGVEHGVCPVPVRVEDVAFLDVVGPLATGQRLGVEGDMADEVEGVEVLAEFLGDQVKR